MLTAEDVAYITSHFVPLRDPAVRADVAAGRLPGPAYVLDDGTEMVAPDHLALAARAGGVDALRPWFEARAPGEWDAYVSGEYAVCLREVSPESILRKGVLIARIEALLRADPPPLDALHEAIDELDALLRPFASSTASASAARSPATATSRRCGSGSREPESPQGNLTSGTDGPRPSAAGPPPPPNPPLDARR